MNSDGFIGLLVRVTFMYLVVLVFLRLSGKRVVGDLSAIDLVVTLILGDLFDDVFWLEVSVPKGVVAIATIIVLHMIAGYASYRSAFLRSLLESSETQIIDNGAFILTGLSRERVNVMEVRSLLREERIDDMNDVRKGHLERNGELSILKREEAKDADRRDLSRLAGGGGEGGE